jgi:sacsin
MWPQDLQDTQDPLCNALEKVMGIIDKESLALWPTDVGYKTAKTGLLGTGAESMPLRNALREAQAPVVYVPKRLQLLSQSIFKDRILSPESLCVFLRSVKSQIKLWSHQTKHDVLEYLLSKPGFINYDGLDLFPFKDGTYRSIGESIAYVHRDSFEEALFSLEAFCNLDLGKFSESTRQTLKRGCELSNIHPAIRYRSASCLKQYCMSSIFKNVAKDHDFVTLEEDAARVVRKVGTWISMRGFFRTGFQEISCLWLLPLSNGRYRKVKPNGAFSMVYFSPPGEVGDLMTRIDARMSFKPFPLLDTEHSTIDPSFLSIITQSEGVMSNLQVQDARRIVFLLRWLQGTSSWVEHITDEERLLIAKHLATHSPQELLEPDRKAIIETLSHLPIFQKVSWKAVGDKMFVVHFRICVKISNVLQGVKFDVDQFELL